LICELKIELLTQAYPSF